MDVEMRSILNGSEFEFPDQLVPLSLYNVAVYTSFSMKNSSARYLDQHIERVKRDALDVLGINVADGEIVEAIRQFIAPFPLNEAFTCRVTIFPAEYNLGAPHLSTRASILVTGRSGSSVGNDPLRLRLVSCERALTGNKVSNIAAAMKLRADAKQAGFDDPIFVADNRITEGPTWNVFFVLAGVAYTPPVSDKLLPGIARQMLLDCSPDKVRECSILVDELDKYEAAFVTNSAIGIKAIKSIGDLTFDTSHPLISSLRDAYYAIEPVRLK
jgi:branched-subunit amino acid aminotransferase/4-amino-4-deoxychorismate lyase